MSASNDSKASAKIYLVKNPAVIVEEYQDWGLKEIENYKCLKYNKVKCL